MNPFHPINIVFTLPCIIAGYQHRGALTIRRSEDGIRVFENNMPVLHYRADTISFEESFARNNYIHPLYTLSGDTLTEDFPGDHLHHRGIFWAWHQVWVGAKRIGDPWLCKDFTWEVVKLNYDILEENAVIRIHTLWKSSDWKDMNEESIPLAKEKTVVAIYPEKRHTRTIDFIITVTSLTDSLKIGGSEDFKGYGGFSWRVKLPEDLKFSGRDGEVKPRTGALKAGHWIVMHGKFMNDKESGILVMVYPSNPGNSETWILRSKSSMQNAVFPGRIPVLMNEGDGFTLKYRMILYEGNYKRINPEKRFREYSRQKNKIQDG